MDYYNGTAGQLGVFKSTTGVTYPLCRTASATGVAYGVTNDWSVVVDQQGIIRYKQHGVNVSAINAVIDRLLATTGVSENGEPVTRFTLHQNYPNPFNPSTQIAFELAKSTQVRLRVYTVRGELVATLLDQNFNAGRHQAVWRAHDQYGKAVAAGVYFYELQAGNFSERKKMVLLR